MRGAWWVSVTLVVCATSGVRAQTTEQRLTAIREALAGADVELALTLGRELVAALPADAPASDRSQASLLLGIASLGLRMQDSAVRHFSRVVALDPVMQLDPERFNPDVVAAFEAARRVTPAVALAIPVDTVVNPEREPWSVDVAIGLPGDVTLEFIPRDSAGAVHAITVPLERRTRVPIGLLLPDSSPLAPGDYTVRAMFAGPDEARASGAIEITVTKVAVDTAPTPPPPDLTLMLPEFRKGPVVVTSVVAGIVVGVAAIAVPSVVPNKDLGVKRDGRALLVGLSLGLGGVIGSVAGRRDVPIDANITRNRAITSDWERQSADVRAANERLIRYAPLRIRRRGGA
jgi:hypothetical protein